MPFYDYRCPAGCAVVEVVHPMTAPRKPPCPACGKVCERVFNTFRFQEDRTRFWRAPDGSKFNIQLGEQMPDTRAGYARAVEEAGGELVSRDQRPDHFKRAQEYADHVQRGGERLAPKELNAFIAEPKEPEVPVATQLREIGYNREEAFAKLRQEGKLLGE